MTQPSRSQPSIRRSDPPPGKGGRRWWRSSPPQHPSGRSFADRAFQSDIKSLFKGEAFLPPEDEDHLRVVLFGSDRQGIEALTHLLWHRVNVVGLVTMKKEGRRQKIAELASERMIPVLRPESLHDPAADAQVGALLPDLIVAAGYLRMIPGRILSLATLGGVNLHPSLLPAYRGAAPWKWALLRGEERAGVTVHVMTPELNGGDIITQEEAPVDPQDNGGTLYRKLACVGGELLARTVRSYRSMSEILMPQDKEHGTYFAAPTTEDARIRWSASARDIRNQVRALHPRPGAWTSLGSLRFSVEDVSIEGNQSDGEPGMIIGGKVGALDVATGAGVLRIREMTLRGRARVTSRDETAAIPAFQAGVRFDDAPAVEHRGHTR